MQQRFRSELRRLLRKRGEVVLGRDFKLRLREYRAGVHSRVEAEYGDGGARTPVHQHALERRGAAVLGQLRGVDVEAAVLRRGEHRLLDYMSEVYDEQDVRRVGLYPFDALRVGGEALSRVGWEAELLRELPDGRAAQREAASRSARRVRQHPFGAQPPGY